MLKIIERFAVIFLFIGIFIFFLRPFEGTGDFYHHVNTGRYIIENHALPNLDTFSHTAKNQPWVAHSWLSGLIFYLILQNFGQIAISIFSAFIATLTFVLLYYLLRIYKASKSASLATIAITAIPISTRWPQRPEIFEYPLILLLLLIDSFKNRYPKLSLFLPFVMLVFANLYGSAVIFGLLLIGLLIVKQFLIDSFKWQKHTIFYLSALAAFPLSLFNGYGLKTILYFYYFIPKVAVYEGEWAGIFRILDKMPLGQLINQQYLILIYFLFLIISLLTAIFSFRIIKQNLFPAFMALSVLAPFFAFRQTPLVTFLSGPFLALSLTYLFSKHQFIKIGLIAFLGIVMFAISFWLNPPGRLSAPSNIALEELISFIQNNNLNGNAFNMGHFGGYITYKLYPKILVFFDTRDELYINSPALTDLYNTYNLSRSVLPLLKKYQVDLVIADYLTDGLSYRDLFYSLDWVIVFLNDRYFIAIPAQTAKLKQIPQIDGPDPFSPTAAKPGQEEKASKYYQNLLIKNPDSLNNKLFLASTLLSLEQFDETINIVNKLQIDPNSLIGEIMEHDRNNLLAESYLGKQDCTKAKVYLDKANSAIRPILIFKPQEQISSEEDRIWSYYYLICQKNLNQATVYFQNFLQDNNVSPLEKIKFSRQFEKLKKALQIKSN